MTDQLDALKQMTDAQARDIRAQMLDAGQLPPPPGAVTLDRAKLPASLDALRDALSGHAMAWGQRAPDGSPVAHYSNGLLYAGVMLQSCRALDRDPAAVLALFATWAAMFARDVLEHHGVSEGDIEHALEHSELSTALLDRLGDPMARGAAGAALAVFYAAAASTAELDPGHALKLFAAAGHALAGADFMPSTGEGLRA